MKYGSWNDGKMLAEEANLYYLHSKEGDKSEQEEKTLKCKIKRTYTVINMIQLSAI